LAVVVGWASGRQSARTLEAGRILTAEPLIDLSEQPPGIRTWHVRAKVLKTFGLDADLAVRSSASREEVIEIEPGNARQ
jgi:hypothetical protein